MEKVTAKSNPYLSRVLWTLTCITLTAAVTLLTTELLSLHKSLTAALSAASAPQLPAAFPAQAAAPVTAVAHQQVLITSERAPEPEPVPIPLPTLQTEQQPQTNDFVSSAVFFVETPTKSTAINTLAAQTSAVESEIHLTTRQTAAATEPAKPASGFDAQQFHQLQTQLDELKTSFAAALELLKAIKDAPDAATRKVDAKKTDASVLAPVPAAPEATVAQKKKEFKIVGATPEFLVVTQGDDTKKIEKGGVLPNGSTFVNFDGRTIVTSLGSYPVR